MPIWDNGRDVAVPKVGNFKPLNNPIASGAVGPNPGIGGWLSVGPVPDNETPVVTVAQDIRARKKVNLYQIQGNHIRYARSVKRWIWWSDFSQGEVHGRLNGFENRLRQVNGSTFGSDLAFHVNLNTQEHWKAMCREAAAAFATFPPDARRS